VLSEKGEMGGCPSEQSDFSVVFIIGIELLTSDAKFLFEAQRYKKVS
jgi:hypothetical protein